MKKKTIMIIAVVLLLVIGALIIIFLLNNSDKTFSLEDKYYGTSEIIKIDVETLSELIDSKGSFALFVSQEMCLASSDFEIVLNEFLEENPLTIYEINFSELTASELGDFLEYYPSFVLYKEGKVIDYLDANADEDLAYYQTSSGFKSWFTTYVNLERMNDNTITNENKNYLYAARGRYYNSDEKYEKAITDYTKSINLSDSNYYNQYLLLRAESYFGKNDYDKAIKDYSDFIKNSPYSIEIRKRLANTYIENSQKVEALEQYKELAEIFPYYNELGTKKTFYNDMANLYYEIQDYQKVIECINEDEVLNGYNVNYKLRALAKMRLNDYKSAYADILKAEKYNIDEKQEILHLKQELEQNVYNPYN